MKKILVVAVISLAGISSAYAQNATSGPKIDGTVELEATATNDVTAAIGNESSATQEIGNIDSGSIDGNITSVVTGTDDVSAAIGNKSCSDQKIGTIGGKSACK
ncbi:hypothetical protein ACFL12_05925 [Pseudomonadota bacterium]